MPDLRQSITDGFGWTVPEGVPFRLTRLAAVYCWLALALLLAGCAAAEPPLNYPASLYDPEKTGANVAGGIKTLSFVEQECPPAGTAGFLMPSSAAGRSRVPRMVMRYSPGDRFNLLVPGSADFSGDYVVNADGLVMLPFTNGVSAVGLTNEELTHKIENSLLQHGLFQGDTFRVSVRPVQYASINITISGAVFLPGRVVIGGVKDADRGDKMLTRSGDSPSDRFIASALRAGGGVRPDADLSRVKLVRAGRTITLDWRGAITGRPVDDFALIEGDHIEVEEAACFQSALVRPSQITPPGVRIFQSNLTQPVLSNANSAIGQTSQNVPYGTRLLAGLVAANCVGGSLASNARRFGVLISRNPKTLRTEVIQRSIEDLVRSADRDTINPYLMPDDAIACYDSAITDASQVATWVQQMLAPIEGTTVLWR